MQSLTAAAAALQAALLAAALLAAAGARACDVQLNAQHFFDLCEAGKGANATAPYVSPGASFSAQVVDALPGPPLSKVSTVAGYSDWMAGVVQEFGPKATVDIKAAALQFPLAHPRVVSIIPGSANAEEAAQNKALLDTDLPKNLWRKFKEAGLVRAEAPMPGDSNASM